MDHGHAAAGEAEGSRSARLQAMHSMQQHQQQLRQGANAHGQVHHGGYGGPSAHDGHGEQQQHRYGGDNAWFSDLDVLEYLLAPGQGDGHGGAGNSAAGGAHAGGSGRAPGNTHGLKRGAPDGAAAAAVAAAAGAAAGTGAGGAETSAPPQRAEKKAKREKARRDRLNDKFADLAKLCVEGTDAAPATDKGTIVSSASNVILALRRELSEARAGAEGARALIAELKAEKNELREEKALLRQQLAEVQRSLAAKKGVELSSRQAARAGDGTGDGCSDGGVGVTPGAYATGQVPALPPVFGSSPADKAPLRPPLA